MSHLHCNCYFDLGRHLSQLSERDDECWTAEMLDWLCRKQCASNYLLSGLYVQSAANTRSIDFVRRLGGNSASQSSSWKVSDEPSAVRARLVLRSTISRASGRSVRSTSTPSKCWAMAMPTMPQPVPSSRTRSRLPVCAENKRFTSSLFSLKRSLTTFDNMMPASLK